MTDEEYRKWLQFKQLGIRPTSTKLRTCIYSDQSVGHELHFSLSDRTVTLQPLAANASPSGFVDGYMPAFICEITVRTVCQSTDRAEIESTLDRVLPLLGFHYAVPYNIEKWEEFEGNWLSVLSPAMYGAMLNEHGELPKKNIHEIVDAYEALSTRKDKRFRKAATIRSRIKEALTLESISKRYSFLSYYSILEIIADDLAVAKQVPTKSQIAIDIANFSLSTKGSQRIKLYFLLSALPNSFNVEAAVMLAETRNEVAHGKEEVPDGQFQLCKELAFWASETFALQLASGA